MHSIYIKTAWRNQKRNVGLNLLNILGLAIGMTAALFIFLWIANETSFDAYHSQADRIYRVTTKTTDGNWTWEGSPGLFAGGIQKGVAGIDNTTRLFTDNWPIIEARGSLSYEKQCAYVDPSWFQFFQYNLLSGSITGFEQDQYGIVITASAAKKYFGKNEPVGQAIRIDSVNYQVQAVVEDPPTNSSFQYNFYIQLAALLTSNEQKEREKSWENTDFITFIKVQPGVSLPKLANSLTETLQKLSHDDSHSIAASLVPLKDIHFENDLQGSKFEHGSISTVYIFGALGFLLLLVACINYVSLTTANASIRAKEVSIRKIIGAGRRILFYQFITESFLVSCISLFLALLFVRLSLPIFNEITGKVFSLSLASLSLWRVLIPTLFVAFVLNSIYPALLLSSFKPLNIFKGVTVLRMKDAYFRKVLVVLQFSISIVLIAGTIVIFKQLKFVQNADPGYYKSQVLSVPFPSYLHLPNKEATMRLIKQDLSSDRNIMGVSLVNQPIVSISSATSGADWEGHDTSKTIKINQLSTDEDLLAIMKLHLAAGRWIEPTDIENGKSFILNETAVKELNLKEPILGKTFRLHGKKGSIIGIVKDFKYRSLHDKTGPLVIFNDPQWWNFFEIRIAPGSAAAAIHAVENAWKQRMPGIPLEYNFLDDEFDNLYRQDHLASALIFIFSIIALIISAMGLFGLAAFEAEQRTKEIGIRKILGATATQLGILLSQGYIRLVLIACAISFPVAWWAVGKWLQNFAYRIDVSWWMISLSGVVALTCTIMIALYHAMKARVSSPVKSLRAD